MHHHDWPQPPDFIDVAAAQARGTCKFMGVELAVGRGALVPRPETELLGRTALAWVPKEEARIVDLCCGCGNLAVALALSMPRARFWASDLTASATELAAANVARHRLSDRVEVKQGDLFAPLAGLEGTMDAIVCNPPYISTKRLEGDRASLLEREPREAFDGGPYGLAIHQRVIREAPRFLRAGGLLFFEIGLGQERQISLLFRRAPEFSHLELVSDAHGNPRVAVAQLARPNGGDHADP